MRIIKLDLILLLSLIVQFPMMAQYYNVRDYGATGNRTLCTAAIQKAIDVAAKAGGGRVVVPAGEYLSGPLFLKSNIVFEVSAGASIYFNNDIVNTPTIMGSWEGIERRVFASLFTGHDLMNVTITGRGKIDGQGQVWWDAYLKTDKIRTEHGIYEREPENPEGSPLKYPRPRMINLYNCKNVQISDISITNSPAWTIHLVYCENVNIQGISIVQPYESPNTDGINPDACNGVRISNCYIDCGDDCIAIKSGYNEHGRKKGIPCQNISIMNCIFAHGRSAIGIGSEMSGGVRNVIVMNCVFNGTLRGLRVKTGRGRGGVVENLLASGIIMDNLREGISIDMGYEGVSDQIIPVTEATPLFKNIRYSNIIGQNIEQAINIIGLPESFPQDIVLENIRLECKRGLMGKYVQGLSLQNVELITNNQQPAFDIANAKDLILNNLSSNKQLENYPMIELKEVDGIVIKDCIIPRTFQFHFMKLTDCKNVEYSDSLLHSDLITK